MMKKRIAILLLILFHFVADNSWGQSQLNFSERAKKREGSRWTLAEWLAQKDRNKLMDQWLWLNAPSPYEFSVLAANNYYKKKLTSDEKEYTITSLEASAYANIFGLSVEYDNRGDENENDLNGLFNVRVLGSSIQSSSLTLSYGQRTRTFSGLDPTSITRNQFYQAALQLYIGRYFGINGSYRSYMSYTDPYFGEVTGYQNQAGAFIEFESLRIYGTYYQDIQKNANPTTPDPEIKREGIKTGLQFFF
jgi:hypothetical protein